MVEGDAKAAEASDETKQLAIRFQRALLERVDKHVTRLKRAHAGLAVTRTDAIRMLLTTALDAAEAQSSKT